MPDGLNTDTLGFYTRPRSLTKVHFLNPQPNEVLLEDVAYHISRSCRFNNGIEPHYSVAEHSILMAHYAISKFNDYDLARQCLMHDASEYLFGDIPATIKKLLPDYKKFEDAFDDYVLRHFGLTPPLDLRVKQLDRQMCSTEQLVLRGHAPDTYNESTLEDEITFHLWNWQTAQSEFLVLFNSLFPYYKDVV